MARIDLSGVVKRFGRTEVVHGIDLTVADGEFVVLVGPSGCGKSTTLRMIAGREESTAGTVSIGGRVVNQVEPKDRNIAMVFQNYAIYPHMTVAKNIGFGLYRSKLSEVDKQARILEAAKMLGLEEYLQRRPSELSGGQRQRVAIGRAMVRNPAVFLFDEPLSNLDAQLRSQMRVEIKKLHQRLGTTIVFVTHDQVEAMTMADRIVVMHAGRIMQAGSPMEVYERPDDVFTARFIGSPTMNILRTTPAGDRSLRFASDSVKLSGEAVGLGRGASDVLVGVRPQDLRLGDDSTPGGLVVAGKVAVVEPLGAETYVHIEAGRDSIVATTTGRISPRVGDTVTASAPADRLSWFDAATEKSLRA
ncbi:sn-glycerol-3-phosphate ABC transporter ATP-binding protein UgpC [soil metagenome]